MELQLQDLRKQYGTKCAVNNVNARLVPGVYGLLGANGAGKTTMILLLMGLIEPTEGRVLLNGIDISEYAISQAKRLAQNANLDIDFRVYDGEHIPFKHNTFDFTISYGVLDSLPFDLAQNLVSQIAYVSKTYFFCSLIGEDSTSGFSNIQESTFTDEIEVQESHEKGTIQSFFDYPKIQRLFKKSTFEIIWGEKKSSVNLIDGSIQSRYYIVCKKAEYEQ